MSWPGFPRYKGSLRMMGQLITISSLITPPSILDVEYATAVGLNDDASQGGQLCNDNWLEDWITLSAEAPLTPTVPAKAQAICTPLDVVQWGKALRNHPNQRLV